MAELQEDGTQAYIQSAIGDTLEQWLGGMLQRALCMEIICLPSKESATIQSQDPHTLIPYDIETRMHLRATPDNSL